MNELQAISSHTQTRSLLAQADLVLLAVSLLRRPDAIALPAPDEIDELLEAIHADSPLRIALGEAILAARQATVDLRRGEWSDEYHRLFEGAMACPPNESACIRRDKGVLLADIMGFYGAFGFTAAQSAGEKPDHLCCELEFVAALLAMQACARQTGQTEHDEVTRHALARFVESHLGLWLASFVSRLGRVTVLPVYAAAGVLLERIWSLLQRQNGWDVASADPRAPDHDDGTPYECGMAGAPVVTALTLHGQPLTPGEAD